MSSTVFVNIIPLKSPRNQKGIASRASPTPSTKRSDYVTLKQASHKIDWVTILRQGGVVVCVPHAGAFIIRAVCTRCHEQWSEVIRFSQDNVVQQQLVTHTSEEQTASNTHQTWALVTSLVCWVRLAAYAVLRDCWSVWLIHATSFRLQLCNTVNCSLVETHLANQIKHHERNVGVKRISECMPKLEDQRRRQQLVCKH